MPSALSAPHFHSEEAAYAYVEARIWPEGPVCPHCGGTERISKMGGKSTRIGTYKCYQCRKPFTVKIGTIFEASHVPMNVWLQAIYLVAGSKKGISSNQLHRTLGVTLKTAWFMSHRIREAMRDGDFTPFGSGGGVVEADETFIGFEPHMLSGEFGAGKRGSHGKMKVLALVDRTIGRSKAYVVDKVAIDFIMPILRENIAREAKLATDDHGVYRRAIKHFAAHGIVRHSRGQYGLGDISYQHRRRLFLDLQAGHARHLPVVRQEASPPLSGGVRFPLFQREANGINDAARADILLAGVVGRRLTYQTARI